MTKIFENKSLRFICNSINVGLVETEEIDINDLEIVSKNNPDFIIKVIEIDISDYVVNMLKKSNILRTKIKKFETSFYDFVVFNTTENTLISISLLELSMIAPKLIQGEQQKNEDEITNTINNNWSFDSEEWDLILQK